MKRKNRFEQFRARALRNPRIRRAYEDGLDELRIAVKLAQLRQKRGLTQTELAAMIQTSPAVISRLERGHNVEFRTLMKVATALHARLTVEPISSAR